MSKYGKAKYGTNKYGRYEIEVPAGIPLSQITRYRLRTIDSKKQYSRPIVNTNVEFPTNGPVRVRIRTNNGSWVTHQTISLPGEKTRIRIKAVSSNGEESRWVESVVGTIRNA